MNLVEIHPASVASIITGSPPFSDTFFRVINFSQLNRQALFLVSASSGFVVLQAFSVLNTAILAVVVTFSQIASGSDHADSVMPFVVSNRRFFLVVQSGFFEMSDLGVLKVNDLCC